MNSSDDMDTCNDMAVTVRYPDDRRTILGVWGSQSRGRRDVSIERVCDGVLSRGGIYLVTARPSVAQTPPAHQV